MEGHTPQSDSIPYTHLGFSHEIGRPQLLAISTIVESTWRNSQAGQTCYRTSAKHSLKRKALGQLAVNNPGASYDRKLASERKEGELTEVHPSLVVDIFGRTFQVGLASHTVWVVLKTGVPCLDGFKRKDTNRLKEFPPWNALFFRGTAVYIPVWSSMDISQIGFL